MAESVYLSLQIDGDEIHGDSTTTSMEREDTIECHSVSCGIESTVDLTDVQRAGKLRVQPVRIRKGIDRSTPFLIKALLNGEPVTRAEFRFFRPNPSGDGTEEQHYTLLLKQARIIEVNQVSDDDVVGGVHAPPPIEEVAFVYGAATWTFVPRGSVAEYGPSSRR